MGGWLIGAIVTMIVSAVIIAGSVIGTSSLYHSKKIRKNNIIKSKQKIEKLNESYKSCDDEVEKEKQANKRDKAENKLRKRLRAFFKITKDPNTNRLNIDYLNNDTNLANPDSGETRTFNTIKSEEAEKYYQNRKTKERAKSEKKQEQIDTKRAENADKSKKSEEDKSTETENVKPMDDTDIKTLPKQKADEFIYTSSTATRDDVRTE